MFNVMLYRSFSKPYNSIKTPTDGDNYPCQSVEPCDIISPVISFNQGSTWNPSQYNYAQIEIWGRFYWVNSWEWNAGRWYAILQVDVLASWKENILNMNEYVLRSASNYDLSIIDQFYPATTNYNVKNVEFPIFDANTLGTGCYVIAIANGKSGSVGGITHYVADFNDMVYLFSFMYENTDWLNGAEIDDISNDLLKCLINPAQFISSVMWFPLPKSVVGNSIETEVSAAWWSTDVSLPLTNGTVILEEKFGRFTHPQQARGTYLNYAPYTSMRLYVPAFGVLEINLEKFPPTSLINIEIQIDTTTGQGTLLIYPSGYSVGSGQQITSQVGVPMALASMQSDILGGLNSIGTTIAHATNIASAIFGTIGAVGDAAKMVSPDVSIIGSNGNISTFKNNACLTAVFKNLVDEDLTHHGRPLFKKVRLGSLSGFTQVRELDTNLPCTLPEQQQIKNFAEGGFYIE